MIEELSFAMVQEALKGISSVKKIKLQDEALTFQYNDKDGDNVTSIVTIQDDERLLCVLMIPISEEHFVTSMICANAYNMRKDAHGTFAYSTQIGDKPFIALEAHLITRGGISEAALKQMLRNFISHIDTFESTMISAIQELGPDSSFLKSSDGESFWGVLGAFFNGYTAASVAQHFRLTYRPNWSFQLTRCDRAAPVG